jgi:F-type H+-transporting ATPase subunit b
MLGPVSISLPTLVVELVIFLLMVSVMEKLLFTPIRTAWAERERSIQEGLASSTEGRDEAEHARAEVQRILQGARREAQGKIDAATAAGGKVRDEQVAAATTEFRRLVAEAQEQIARERERTASELQRRIVDIALEAASTVTGERYDQPQVRELAAAVITREGLR